MRRRLQVSIAPALLAAAASCVHHPLRVELHRADRAEAMRSAESALRTRFAEVSFAEADLGLLSTDYRYSSGSPITRARAFVALTPGEFGWAAEITVVREALDFDEADFFAPGARWKFLGRDREMERFLADEATGESGERPATRP